MRRLQRRGLLLRLPALSAATLPAALRRRVLASVVAVLLVAGGVILPTPAAVVADGSEPASISLDQPCGPPFSGDDATPRPTLDMTVRGRDWTPSTTVSVTYAPGAPEQASSTAEADQYGVFSVTFSVPQALDGQTFQIQATNDLEEAVTQFSSPCRPSISIAPDCGAPLDDPADPSNEPYTISVSGRDFRFDSTAVAYTIRFTTLTEQEMASSTEVVVSGGVLTGEIRPRRVPPGIYLIWVTGESIVTSAPIELAAFVRTDPRAVFFVPCVTPTVSVTPDCTPPGPSTSRYALNAYGTGFLPNLTIELIFDADGSPETYRFRQDVPESGAWGPLAFDPLQRPARDPPYVLIARQVAGTQVVREARTEFRVDCPPVPEPQVLIDPPGCGPPQLVDDAQRTYGLTVRGSAFPPDSEVDVIFDAEGLSADLGSASETVRAKVLTDGTFATPLSVTGRPTGTYLVVAQPLDDGEPLGEPIPAEVRFSVPCSPAAAELSRTPRCGPEAVGQPDAYSVEVTGSGFIPGRVVVVFDAGGSEEPFPVTAADDGTLTLTIAADGRPAGSYVIGARQADARGVIVDVSAARPFVIPCPSRAEPVLRVIPSAAVPGSVVRVEGTDFPAGGALTLSWDRGIDLEAASFVVDASGSFTVQVLIFHHDFLGARTLRADEVGQADAFPTARVGLLVAAGQGSPPAGAAIDPFTGLPTAPIIGRR